jgi:hypothetical protein
MGEPAFDALISHRRERWVVELLDARTEKLLADLRATAGKVDWNVNATIRSSCTLNLEGLAGYDWRQVRIRLRYALDGPGGGDWPLGVFLPATPLEEWDVGVSHTVEAYDKMVILDDDQTSSAWTYPAGQNIVQAVVQVIESTGEMSHVIPASTKSLGASMTWDVGTPKLRIVNDLLEAAGYFSVWCDGLGRYRADPYVPPADRPVVWDFVDHPVRSIFMNRFEREMDGFHVPNRVVMIGRSEDQETPPPFAVAQNEDPDSEWSYQARGRWITYTEGVEAADGETLDSLAARKLRDLTGASRSLTLRHAMIPLVPNDVVRVRVGDALNVLASVQTMSVSIGTGELVESRLMEVQS